MNIAESLVGHLLTRNGVKYLIIKAQEAAVVAAYRDHTGTLQRVLVPLADALQCVELDELDVPDVAETEPANDVTLA